MRLKHRCPRASTQIIPTLIQFRTLYYDLTEQSDRHPDEETNYEEEAHFKHARTRTRTRGHTQKK